MGNPSRYRRLIMPTALRVRMDNAMLVRGLADRTRQSYLEAITKLARYYRLSPDTLTAAQVEAWLLYLAKERQLSFSTVNQAASACRLLYHTVLGQDQASFIIPMAKRPQRQPEILARAEVASLLAAAPELTSRTLLMTIYAAGLRVSEACSLQVTDIDSAPDRLCLRVRQGKGGQDRYTLLAPTLLAALREYWRCEKPRLWLFPNPYGTAPIDIRTAQRRYNQARSAAHIRKTGGVHTLRHCFATHLLESGVDLVTIQKLMGHKDLSTTGRYLHLVSMQWQRPRQNLSPFDLLAALPTPQPSKP